MYVAQNEGFFDANGVKVEFIPVASAPERDQLIASGQADGMINEVVSTILYNKDQVRVQVVRYARAATSEAALFSILAAGKSGVDTLEGLKGVEIGISEGTVIEYLTDRLLEAESFAPDEIKTVAVPKIPDRMALLGTGELKAAMLPEPASSVAVQQGASVILNDTSHPQYSYSVITFRKEIIDQHPEAIRAFLAAIETAVGIINAQPDQYKDVLAERKIVPSPLLETFRVPKFATAGVPSQEQYADTLAWAKEKGLLEEDVTYQETINNSLLP
jgi:NitT/TauT family transport system substrate-binding protein